MTSFTAEWYDSAMTGEGEPAMLPLEESPWLEMYTRLAAMIDPYEEVVDLGCGTGRFIELLRRHEHYAPITGVDWSSAALAEAKSYARSPKNSWLLEDLRQWKPDPGRASNTVFVCSEVLEHLEEDIQLVWRIPPGHRFLFTVPNFSSESHLRVFTSAGQIWRRYSELLILRSWRMVGTERKGIHVVESLRRADSW